MAAAHRSRTASSDVIDLCSGSSSGSSSSSDDHDDDADGMKDGRRPEQHRDGDGAEGGWDCGCRFYAKFIYPELGKVLQQGGRGVVDDLSEEDLKGDACNRDERWVTLEQLKLGVHEPQFLVDLKELPEVKRRVGGFSVLPPWRHLRPSLGTAAKIMLAGPC